jgi:hypothetical protein
MKGLQVTKNVRSDEKGTKGLQRDYEINYQGTKKVRSYKKCTKLRKGTKWLQRWYEITKKVQSYEEGTKGLRRGYEISYKVTKLRNKLRKALVAKLPSYEIVTPPIGIICYDVL